tara:strand:- start:29 stop:436 length:408 start_codon:yes stop_codon:yes gene_type:complete
MKKLILIVALVPILWASNKGKAYKTTECSYYGEGDSYKKGDLMASGKKFDPSKPYIASLDYPFGTQLELKYGTNVVVGVVQDRGPSRFLYNKGRKLDLTPYLMGKLVGTNLVEYKGKVMPEYKLKGVATVQYKVK